MERKTNERRRAVDDWSRASESQAAAPLSSDAVGRRAPQFISTPLQFAFQPNLTQQDLT